MKWKYLLGISLSILIIVLLYYVWGNQLLQKKNDPAFLVPQNTYFYMEQKEIGKLIDGFKASRLGKSIASIDIRKIGVAFNLDEEQILELDRAKQAIADLGDNPMFRELCGKSLSTAVIAGDSDAVIAGRTQQLPFEILLVARPEHKAELLQLISAAFTDEVKKGVTSYRNTEISQFAVDETLFFAATVDGLFLFSPAEKTLKASLDLVAESKNSLAELHEYDILRKQVPDSEFLAFSSPEEIGKELAKRNQNGGSFAELSGLRYSVYGIWQENGRFRDRSITMIDREKLDPTVKKLLAAQPVENASLALVPADVRIYYWSNTLVLSSFWDMIRQGKDADQPNPDELNRTFREITGKEIEEVLAMFDNGISLQARKGSSDGLLPLPYFTFFFQVKDKTAVEEVVGKSVAHFGIPISSVRYKNMSYNAYNPGLPGEIEALYGFHGNTLFLSNNRKMLENIFDTIDNGNGFKQSREYAELGLEFEKGNNSVCFLKMAEIIDGIKEMTALAGSLLAMQDQKLAAQSQVVIDEVLNPLLEGISMISWIGTRSAIIGDTITVESTIGMSQETSATGK